MHVQIDWFQVYFRGLLNFSPAFSGTPSGLRSKIFASVDKIYYHSKFFGILSYKPLSRIIPDNAYILKVDNQILYSKEFENIYFQFSMFCGLKYQNITRLDICTDFNTFQNFRSPENLIKGFFNGSLIYCNKSLFKIIGRCARPPISDYLRFGSNLSELSVYLYRKSLEMKQVKFKCWIFDQWKKTGIDINKDVWRLEFSLKGGHHYLIDHKTKQKILINDQIPFDDDLRITLFEALIKKHFEFRTNKKKIKTSRLKKISLFEIFNKDFQHIVLAEHQELNRTAKIFIKNLEKLNSEVREYNSDLAYKVMEISAHVSEKTGLEKYRQYISVN